MELQEKQLAFHVTSACTLNCKLCVNLMPRFKKRCLAGHIPLEQIEREISAVFRIYDFIEDVTISGGEPLLHPKLSEIVDFCMSFERQFHSLRIFTNGTILPRQRLVEQIKVGGGKLQLVVDDYGSEHSRKTGKIKALFEKNRLPLRINCYCGVEQHCGGWIDYGSPKQHRGYSGDELQKLYQNCHVAQYKCIGVFNGKMVNCCWAIFGRELGYMPFENGTPDPQLIDLLDTTVPLEEKRRIASAYGTTPIWACQYCNGFDLERSERFPAGEQV